jgi:hypothetical protein
VRCFHSLYDTDLAQISVLYVLHTAMIGKRCSWPLRANVMWAVEQHSPGIANRPSAVCPQ